MADKHPRHIQQKRVKKSRSINNDAITGDIVPGELVVDLEGQQLFTRNEGVKAPLIPIGLKAINPDLEGNQLNIYFNDGKTRNASAALKPKKGGMGLDIVSARGAIDLSARTITANKKEILTTDPDQKVDPAKLLSPDIEAGKQYLLTAKGWEQYVKPSASQAGVPDVPDLPTYTSYVRRSGQSGIREWVKLPEVEFNLQNGETVKPLDGTKFSLSSDGSIEFKRDSSTHGIIITAKPPKGGSGGGSANAEKLQKDTYSAELEFQAANPKEKGSIDTLSFKVGGFLKAGVPAWKAKGVPKVVFSADVWHGNKYEAIPLISAEYKNFEDLLKIGRRTAVLSLETNKLQINGLSFDIYVQGIVKKMPKPAPTVDYEAEIRDLRQELAELKKLVTA